MTISVAVSLRLASYKRSLIEMAGSTDYNEALQALEKQRDIEAKALYERLAMQDIQAAADVMASVYGNTHKRDGYVFIWVRMSQAASPYFGRPFKML